MFRILIASILFISCACSRQGSERPETDLTSSPLKYAQKYQFRKDGVRVTEPWPGAIQVKDYMLDKVPERVVVTSTTHLPYLEMLGVEDRLVGFPSTQYISSQKILERVASGEIKDLGPDGNINMEMLLSLDPDMVFAFDMGQESTVLDKIQEVGIPVVYNSDYLENTALGRAEWIKFFGAFFDKRNEADSIFDQIVHRYDSLKSLTEEVTERPSVLSGVMYGDVWFLPGGDNWAAQFYQDAGGDYLWSTDSSSGWLEISFESVFNKAHNADYWIGVSTYQTLDQLASQDERYTNFKAFENQRVFNFSKRIATGGGFDFFESGYSRPDIVLADLIKILHPELLPAYESYYFEQL